MATYFGTRVLLSASSSAAASTPPSPFLTSAITAARRSFLHRRRRLLPVRGPLSILTSAGSATLSLLTSQSSRDDFADLADRNVIDSAVLGQSNLGWAKVLALQHDLNQPLFRDFGFRPAEFLEGAKVSLGLFHDINARVVDGAVERRKEFFASELLNDDEKDDAKEGDEDAPEDGRFLGTLTMKEMELAKQVSNSMIGIQLVNEPPSSDADSEPKYPPAPPPYVDFVAIAQKDSESPEARLVDMLGKESLEFAQIEAAIRAATLGADKLLKDVAYVPGSTKVKHVALISAQVDEIHESDDDSTEKIIDDPDHSEDPNASMVDDAFLNDVVKEPSVVAQLEVLYAVDLSFRAKMLKGASDGVSSDASSAPGSDEEASEEFEEKTSDAEFVYVGTFEGYLRGGPEEDGLRWWLTSYRPAFEFGYQ